MFSPTQLAMYTEKLEDTLAGRLGRTTGLEGLNLGALDGDQAHLPLGPVRGAQLVSSV